MADAARDDRSVDNRPVVYVAYPSLWLVNKAKVEPKTVQGILGPAKIQTTLDLYARNGGDETRAQGLLEQLSIELQELARVGRAS